MTHKSVYVGFGLVMGSYLTGWAIPDTIKAWKQSHNENHVEIVTSKNPDTVSKIKLQEILFKDSIDLHKKQYLETDTIINNSSLSKGPSEPL